MPEYDSTTEYRPIPNYPGYIAGSDGSVWSNRTRGAATRYAVHTEKWRKLKPAYMTGYPVVTLCAHGKKQSRHVHVIVLLTFVGPPLPKQECRHLDGSRDNNRLTNLRWGTRVENHQDKIDHGRSRRGELNNKAKATDNIVRLIRKLSAEGHTGASIAKLVGLSNATTCKIIRRDLWKHVE